MVTNSTFGDGTLDGITISVLSSLQPICNKKVKKIVLTKPRPTDWALNLASTAAMVATIVAKTKVFKEVVHFNCSPYLCTIKRLM
jgi:hypothetical protein